MAPRRAVLRTTLIWVGGQHRPCPMHGRGTDISGRTQIIFEGCDAAWKDRTIKRNVEHLIHVSYDSRRGGLRVRLFRDGYITAARFLPPRLMPPNLLLNCRDHRRLLLMRGIRHRKADAGERSLSAEYAPARG